ncbi:small multi-drug export protein [Methanofollis ethanolicus]|uniref:small multi-drug export protein n=1 Tax=Methanofollis ethanolicus TaxID=488124 RepID=UPI000830AB19|nr:small multi-drug export protein [Methanofollis ethanolicus]
MNPDHLFTLLRQTSKVILIVVVFALLLPLLLGFALSVPPGVVLGLISSTLLLQANAVFVGVAMGLRPAMILAVMTLVEVGAVLAIFETCDTFAIQSARVRAMLEKTEKKMQTMKYLSKYGVYTLLFLPVFPIIGLYSSVVIAWILQWDRHLSLLFITLGWIGICLVLMLMKIGVLKIVF